MDKIKWIIAIVVFIIYTALAVFSGYHLKKDKVCPEIIIKDSSYTKPLPPQTAHLEIIKPGKPIASDSGLWDASGDSINNPNFKPAIGRDSIKIYSELIDTTIIFQNDSLDFVADINFSTKSQEFMNFFDFNLRTTEKIKEVVKEVLVPMKPEIYQNEWVIALIALTSFLFGLVF